MAKCITYSLENDLKERAVTSFPSGKRYGDIYELTKQYLNTHIHPEIKSVAHSFLNGEYLNNHGEPHIRDVISRASRLVSPIQEDLRSYELFLLLMAIQMHDAGHIIQGRKEHAETVKKLINQVLGNNIQIAGLDALEKRCIFQLIKAHSGKDDPIGMLEEEVLLFGEKVRMRMLAAIVRLADELAEDCLRASTYLLETEHQIINEKSRIFHKYSQALNSVFVENESHEIKMEFVLKKCDVASPISIGEGSKYLIDEIYDRSVKTFTEMIYYNRFVPEKIRMTRLVVNIEFLEEQALEDFLPRMSYRLEESGYPRLKFDSVFEMDRNALHDQGLQKNGEYFKTKLENL